MDLTASHFSTCPVCPVKGWRTELWPSDIIGFQKGTGWNFTHEAINTNNRVLINSTFQHTYAQKSRLGYPIIRLCCRHQLTLISVTFCALDTAHSFLLTAHSLVARRENTSGEMWLFCLDMGELGQRKGKSRKNGWMKQKKEHFVFLLIFHVIYHCFIYFFYWPFPVQECLR